MELAHTPTGGTYDRRAGDLIRDYPDFWVGGGFEGVGYRARFRHPEHRYPVGRELAALSLDELAALMDACRAERAATG